MNWGSRADESGAVHSELNAKDLEVVFSTGLAGGRHTVSLEVVSGSVELASYVVTSTNTNGDPAGLTVRAPAAGAAIGGGDEEARLQSDGFAAFASFEVAAPWARRPIQLPRLCGAVSSSRSGSMYNDYDARDYT